MMTLFSIWYDGLDPTLRFYWGVAIFATIIFVIQTTMSFIGIGDADDASAAQMSVETADDGLDDAGAMHLLSIRNVVYFLLGFGWSGVSFWATIPNPVFLAIVSIVVGCSFVGIFLYLFRQMMRLQSNGAFDINDAVGKVCDVYLRIPPSGHGLGKVQISFNGSIHELDAMSETEESIPSGSRVRVLRVVEKHILIVEFI